MAKKVDDYKQSTPPKLTIIKGVPIPAGVRPGGPKDTIARMGWGDCIEFAERATAWNFSMAMRRMGFRPVMRPFDGAWRVWKTEKESK